MMMNIPLKQSWEAFLEFLKQLERAKESVGFRDGEECFYRGLPRVEYKLVPTLFRTPRDYDQHLEVEGNLFFEFKARAHALHGEGLSEWDVLFYMRHHGAPTRLLDWSESFGVALYFALHDDKSRPIEESPCIHVLNPYALNEQSFWEERELVSPKYIWYAEDDLEFWDFGDILLEGIGMDWQTPIAIYPEQRALRVRAQKGWFTLHGDDVRPLDEQVPGVASKVDLPPEAIPAARHFLDLAGLDDFAVFPDLDGLARTLTAKNTPEGESVARKRQSLAEWK